MTKRQPAGIPIGGEFAANEHDEASSSLTGGEGLFDRIGTGDSVIVDWKHQPEGMEAIAGTLFRDYDGQMKLVAIHSSPLQDRRSHEWARDHERAYEDFLSQEYDADREASSGRIVIESDVDEYSDTDEGESIGRAFRSDPMTYFARQVDSGEFQRKVDEMIERDTIGVLGDRPTRAEEQEMSNAVDDYNAGEIDAISLPVAMTLARSFSKGTSAVLPKMEAFARTGYGSADHLSDELNRYFSRRNRPARGASDSDSIRASEGESRRYLALLGFLEGDRE